MRKEILIALTALMLSACSSTPHPRIIEPTAEAPVLKLTRNMASQIEVPASEGMVQSVVIGDPDLAVVDRNDNIISIAPKDNTGATNIIVHTIDEDGNTHVHQYLIEVR